MKEKKVVDDISYLEQQGGVLMDCLITICHAHHLDVSRVSLLSGLPLDSGELSPTGFERAAKRAGLASRTVKRDLDHINTALLPAVLVLNEKQACVLHGLEPTHARVSYPELDDAVVEVPRDELAARYTGYIIFARPEMHAQETNAQIDKSSVGHWLWSSIKSAKGLSPALQMHDLGLRVGLGTDGPMSGNTLDIIGQMGYVAKLHKLDNNDRTVMPPIKVVEMATIGGARAIHRENELGSIETGKLADVVVVEVQSANMVPIYNPYSALVYSANASNVATVIVNGKVIVKNKVLQTYDETKSRQMMIEFSDRVRAISKTL